MGAWRAPLVAGRAPAPESSRAMRAVAIGLLAVVKQFGGLLSGSNPIANAAGAKDAHHAGAEATTTRAPRRPPRRSSAGSPPRVGRWITVVVLACLAAHRRRLQQHRRPRRDLERQARERPRPEAPSQSAA